MQAQLQTSQNLGFSNPHLMQLMQRYVMSSPSYQRMQPMNNMAQPNPYIGRKYSYFGDKANIPQPPAQVAPTSTPVSPIFWGEWNN